MEPKLDRPCTAFAGFKKIADGEVTEVARKVKKYMEKDSEVRILIFDDRTSLPVEVDFRGNADAVLKRLKAFSSENEEPEKSTGPGRPKLGVVSREIGLLPRHWEWLALQPGGASVTLRKLVEDAKKRNHSRDEIRQSQEAAYKFMTAMAGDLPHLEDALRAFYAKDDAKFEKLMGDWPTDIREHARKIGETFLNS
jgi:hypothetical protein